MIGFAVVRRTFLSDESAGISTQAKARIAEESDINILSYQREYATAASGRLDSRPVRAGQLGQMITVGR